MSLPESRALLKNSAESHECYPQACFPPCDFCPVYREQHQKAEIPDPYSLAITQEVGMGARLSVERYAASYQCQQVIEDASTIISDPTVHVLVGDPLPHVVDVGRGLLREVEVNIPAMSCRGLSGPPHGQHLGNAPYDRKLDLHH